MRLEKGPPPPLLPMQPTRLYHFKSLMVFNTEPTLGRTKNVFQTAYPCLLHTKELALLASFFKWPDCSSRWTFWVGAGCRLEWSWEQTVSHKGMNWERQWLWRQPQPHLGKCTLVSWFRLKQGTLLFFCGRRSDGNFCIEKLLIAWCIFSNWAQN